MAPAESITSANPALVEGALVNEAVPTRYRDTANGWAAAAGVVGAVIGLALFGIISDAVGGFDTATRIL